MIRLLNKDNQTARDLMAKLIKGYVGENQPINFTDGSEMYIGQDGKIKYAVLDAEVDDVVVKKWGKIKFENRQAIIAQLEANPKFKKYAEKFLDGIKGDLKEHMEDTKLLIDVLTIYFKDEKTPLDINNSIHTGHVYGTPAWNGLSLGLTSDAFIRTVVQNLMDINIEFTVKSNETIKKVLELREKFKAFDALLDPKKKENKERVGLILKSYIISGNTIPFVELDAPSNKLVYVGPMVGISGKGFKKWGTIAWEDRVELLRTLSTDENFVNFANTLSR